ncbi:MAG: hypothetical protein AABM66_14310 [Actinomycetota bacterium]
MVAANYLGPYIASALGKDRSQQFADLGPSADPAADEAAHERAVSLVLAAADADARIGDYESAIAWLSLVEQLNLVIPSEYVARRHEWRQKLQSDVAPDAAAERIDPSHASAAAAISDLERRVVGYGRSSTAPKARCASTSRRWMREWTISSLSLCAAEFSRAPGRADGLTRRREQ